MVKLNNKFQQLKKELAELSNSVSSIKEALNLEEGYLKSLSTSMEKLSDTLDKAISKDQKAIACCATCYECPDFTDEELASIKWEEESNEGKTLNKPFRTPEGPKKFSVYVKNDKGNIVKVNFGDPNMEIKRDDPVRRKSFRSRHNCDNPGPKWKARYWSCKMWEKKKSVTDVLS